MILEKKNVHYISRNTQLAKGINRDCFGIRARLALELAEMDLPVLPGLLFDGNIAGNLKEISFSENLEEYMNKFKAEVGKTYANPEHPLLKTALKVRKKPGILRFWAFSLVRWKGLEPPTY